MSTENTNALTGQICLITGATRGIGRAIALALGEHGATVIGTATSEDGAKKITAYLREQNIAGDGAVLNVTDDDAVKKLLGEIEKNHGALTVLVNNAGITRDNLLLRMKDEDWDAVMDTNLKSVFRLSKAVLRGMSKARHGRIINIASVVGAIGNAGQSNYAAAKAGMVGFSKSLAREVASRNITVNVIAPGFIDTDMTAALPDQQRDALTAQIPLARLGTPRDIAGAVVFLAGGAGDYITGATLHINGGMFMA